MTRVHLLSDLHLEFHPYTYKPPKGGVDLIVLAGDISSHLGNVPALVGQRRLVTLLRQCRQAAPVVYVPGNHDYYGHVLDNRRIELRLLCADLGVRFLDGDALTIADLRVFGATMWSDFSLPGFGFGVREVQGLNDFRCIGSSSGRPITPAEMAERHRTAAEALQVAIDSETPPDLVVTHFLPCPEAIDERFARSPLNAYFCTDLRRFMRGPRAPRAWFCGHTHHCIDRQVEQTRVVCNPRGYPGENHDYKSNLVIEL